MEAELNAIKTSVNGILTTQKSGLSASEIEDLYKILLGVELPFRKFNCRNAEEFVLKYMLSVATCRNVAGKMIFMPIIMDEARHVASLVSRTKDSKKPKPKKVVAYNYKLKHPAPHLKKQSKYSPKFVSEASRGPSSHSKPSFNTNGPSQAPFKMSGSQFNYHNNNFPGSSGLVKKHFESSGQYGASSQSFDKPRTGGGGEGYYNRPYEAYNRPYEAYNRPYEAYNDTTKHKYLATDDGDVFQRKSDKEIDAIKAPRIKSVVVVPTASKVSDHEASICSQDSTSVLSDSQFSPKDFENLRISVQAKEHFRERTVSFPKRSNNPDEPRVERHLQSVSSFPNTNASNNDHPSFGRSLSLNEQGQGKQKMSITFKGKDDAMKSYASSWLSDRVATVEPPPISGYDDRVRSPSTTPTRDGLYSPMTTPHKDGLYSPMGTPVPNNAHSAAARAFPANTFVMPKSPVQLSKFSNGNVPFKSPYSDSGKPGTSFQYSPQSLIPKQHSSTPIHPPLITEDPSIIPPVTSPSSVKLTSQLYSLNSTKALSSSLSPIQVSASPFDVKVIQTSVTNGNGSTHGSNTSHASITRQQSSSSDHSQVNGDAEEIDMIVVTEVHSMSLVLGHFKNSSNPVTFALTNLEDLIEVDLDYVRILLLNRVFRAAFDYNLSKCYGTLYKRNVSSWINMNLFILEETLDPLSVRLQRSSQSRPTYTVSELFSIRRKSRGYENNTLTKSIQEQDVISEQEPIKFDNLERKLAILRKWEDGGKIVLEFLSLDEDVEGLQKKSPKPLRPKVDGRTIVECYLKGYSDQEVEWTPCRMSKMRDLLRVGSKVLVRIFERSCCGDPNVFSIDLRSLERCSFLTEILRREPSLCPQWKVEQVEMPLNGERIVVTHVRSLQQIYALPLKFFEPFGAMFTSMQEFYGKQGGKSFDAPSQLRCLCAFKSSDDGMWYRGRVEDLRQSDMILIYSVDFGNYETLPGSSLRELPNSFRNIPLLSCYLKLSGTVTTTRNDLEARVLHKVFRYFPLKPKNQLSPGVLLNPCENAPLVF